jgi:transposase
MKAYSIDLRQKIIEVYEREEISQRQLARRFDVALSFIVQGATSAPKALCGKGFELPPSPGNLEQLTIKRTR